jgi:predicted DNA-binding transcriptional regulator YafY
MVETSARLLRLLSLLQARRDWTGAALAERLEVSERTVRRDVERLRDLGYPVHATRGTDGGYRLDAGTAMPPLLLDDEEAVAVAVGLRTAAGIIAGIEETSVRALAKLEQVLPVRLRHRVNALQTYTEPVPADRPAPAVDPRVLTLLAAACRDQERLRFDYLGHDGSPGVRAVEPHRLVSWGRRWYLVAWDLDRQDWRTFRVDRIEEPTPLAARFAPRALPAADPAAFVEQRFAALPSRYEARITLHAPAESIRVAPPWGTVTPIDEQTCEYRTGDDDLGWLATRVAMLGVDFEVHEPPELIEQLRVLARRLDRAAS